MSTGDVNNDCNPDLIIQGATLTVRLGRGNGTFQSPITFDAGTFDPALADVNGDGLLDIVTSYLPNQQLGVMYNLDGGAFRAPVGITTGLPTANALGVAVGDIDGDGIANDFATGTEDWASATDGVVMRTTSDAGLGGRRDVFDFGSTKVWSAAIGDLDRDGGRDVVFGRFTFTGGVTVVRSGAAGLAPAVPYAAPSNGYPIVVRIADVTGDGWNDIVGGLWGTGQVAVWANRQDGTFASSPAVTTLGFSTCNSSSGCLWGLTVADLNRDGRADVVVPGINDNRLSVLLSVDGGFPTVSETYAVGDAGTRPVRSAAADFNRDGRPDVVVVTENGPTVLFNHCP